MRMPSNETRRLGKFIFLYQWRLLICCSRALTDKAVESARAARKKRWICFWILVVLVIIIAIVVTVAVLQSGARK